MILLTSHVSNPEMPIWALAPFALMLLIIALGPLFFNHWWEQNRNKLIVSVALGIPISIYLIAKGLSHDLIHQLLFDYIPFIILLGALFTITGGIHLKGDIEAKPWINTLFLGIGAILASIMGTTGAAMLLIRPVIKTNSQRKYKVHTILFFIATVANCGGLLTPLGDPPLFLLYLRGAEFTWFLSMIPEWAVTNGLLLLIYFIVDSYFYKKEPIASIILDKLQKEPIKLKGNLNFLWLIGVILSVAFLNKGYFPEWDSSQGGEDILGFIREGALILMAVLSLIFTRKSLREANKFTWTPILEVAFLFLGIFTTMVPALLYLKANASSFGLSAPWHFYYATGGLSAFLDNAPTAVSFYELAKGMMVINDGTTLFAGNPVTSGLVAGIPQMILTAVSIGAVFFGSMTYIGNGPNFMVKAIAEENKINMPGFFGYILKFSLIVLLPVYIIVQLIFI
jgi:Na+/H+ antiporter NhaD/arsenite permease-like protein